MIKKLQARGEQRKGRGFGFVTLASEELQQKAVAEMNGKDIDGREIAANGGAQEAAPEAAQDAAQEQAPAAPAAPAAA